MEFAFLTYPEVEGVPIRWDDAVAKSPELVAAALAAGFSEWEVRESPVGVLEQDWSASLDWAFKVGARALIGMNGCTLIELPPSLVEAPDAEPDAAGDRGRT
jgi:hypothetical protein